MFDATEVLNDLQRQWFHTDKPKTVAAREAFAVAPLWPKLAEHPAEIKRVNDMLSFVSADCSYELWRNVVWSVLSTGWQCAESIALDWSRSAPDRYDENTFQTVANSFDPNRGVSLGTLVHHAFEGGYSDSKDRGFIDVTPDQGRVRFSFRSAEEIRNQPAIRWRIKGLLPETGIGAIFGQSGSGKTFFGFDMAACISLGRTFYGRKVSSCPVVYVALEGAAGVSQRVQAWEMSQKQNLPDTFRVVTDALSLIGSDAIGFAEALNDAGLGGGVVIIDTLNQAAPGADENSPAAMGSIISNAMIIQRHCNSLVILVHHSGKDQRMGMRGHSSLVAAMDVTIKVERKNTGREWSIDKLKDGDDGGLYPFKLDVVNLGVDADGDPITSCVAVADSFRVVKAKPPTGKNQILVLEAIKYFASDSPTITYQDAVRVAHEAIPKEVGKHRKERADSAINSLITGGHILRNGDLLEVV